MPKKTAKLSNAAGGIQPKKKLTISHGPVVSRNGVNHPLDEPIMGCDHLEFCPHALDRMIQRGITRDDIIQALKKPSKRNLRSDPPKKRISWRKPDGTELNVVFVLKPKKLVVVTAYVPD